MIHTPVIGTRVQFWGQNYHTIFNGKIGTIVSDEIFDEVKFKITFDECPEIEGTSFREEALCYKGWLYLLNDPEAIERQNQLNKTQEQEIRLKFALKYL